MNVLKNQCCDDADRKCGCANQVELHFGFGTVQISDSKVLKANSAELSGFTAAGSWRLAGANLSGVVEAVSLQLTVMNGPAVVATGSSSRPSADLFAVGNEGKGITHLNLFNQIPAEGYGQERVGHLDTLIRNGYLRMNKDEIAGNDCGSSPESAAHRRLETVSHPQACAQSDSENQHNAGEKITASRSEDFNIIHETIIAGAAACDSEGRN